MYDIKSKYSQNPYLYETFGELDILLMHKSHKKYDKDIIK